MSERRCIATYLDGLLPKIDRVNALQASTPWCHRFRTSVQAGIADVANWSKVIE